MRRRAVAAVGGVVCTGVAASAVLERPVADVSDGLWYDARGQVIPVEGRENGGRVVDEGKWTFRNAVTEAGLRAAQAVVIPLVALASHGALRVQNSLTVTDDELLRAEIDKGARRGRGLLTVSNHCSVLDDPFLLGAILPMPLAMNAQKARWSTCSQEVCFSRGALLSSFFGAGKTLPIKRGGGIEQPALATLGDKLAKGDWVHLFPEGHVYQDGTVGRGRGSHSQNERDEATRRRIGLLKRGTAKLIAHAPTPLLVIPFVHRGMDQLMPYDTTGKCESKIWKVNKAVNVKVGEPIDFQDLIDQHERDYGALQRYGTSSSSSGEKTEWPASNETHDVLYTKILARIQNTLIELQRKQNQALTSRGQKEIRPQKQESDG